MNSYAKTVLLIVTFFTWSFFIIASCDGTTICKGENTSLNCLVNNFDELYLSDYSLFWKILRTAEKKAISCQSISETAIFISLASLKSTNAEFNEYYNEVIETLIVINPKCFFASLSTLNKYVIAAVINKLRHPIFIDKTEIYKVFSKNKKIPKYKVIMENYFNQEVGK